MKTLIFLVLFFSSLNLFASGPIYYSFDKVELSEGDTSIQAELNIDKTKLKYLKIHTSKAMYTLESMYIDKILNPKLSTMTYGLIPYNVEGDGTYVEEVSLSYYGDLRCSSGGELWASEDKLKILFWGEEFQTIFVKGDCAD